MLLTGDVNYKDLRNMTDVRDQYRLKQVPATPEYRNSAGRLLRLLEMLRSQQPYYEMVATFYEDVESEARGQIVLEYLQLVSSAYQEFLADLESIPDETKKVLKEGLLNLRQIIFPINLGNAPRPLQDAEIALLRMAATMLPQEDEFSTGDQEAISTSIESLRQTIDQSELPKSVRTALLEIVRLSRNALDQYNIYGARGFKAAFKRMLSELMEVYLDQGAENVRNKSWWKQACEHVQRFDKLASTLLKCKQLLDSIRIFIDATI